MQYDDIYLLQNHQRSSFQLHVTLQLRTMIGTMKWFVLSMVEYNNRMNYSIVSIPIFIRLWQSNENIRICTI